MTPAILTLVALLQLHEKKAVTAEISETVFKNLLMAVHLHGQHDSISTKLLAAILETYEMLRPIFHGLADTMLQVPGISPQNLAVGVSNINVYLYLLHCSS